MSLPESPADRIAREIELALTVAKIEAASMAYAREWFSDATTVEVRMAKSNVIGTLQSHLRQLQAGAYVAPPREKTVRA